MEKFLVARRLMYWQVYLHKTSVAAEQLLIKILSRAKELASSGVELFCAPALHYFLYNNITAREFSLGSEAMRQYALLDDSDVLSAIKAWMSCPDRVLSLLCEAFNNRQLFRGRLLSEPLSEENKRILTAYYVDRLGIDKADAHYFFVEHITTSNTYSEKDDSIDILYKDGTVRDIGTASEILDIKLLIRKPQRLYLYQFRG